MINISTQTFTRLVRSTLTTRQRDLLQVLLRHNGPIIASDVASQMELTPRQVTYSLKSVRSWLNAQDIELKITPGVGIELIYTNDASKASLQKSLTHPNNFKLIFSAGQRQQLFALYLLTSTEPLILYNLQQLGRTSRTTVLKDLTFVADWLESFELTLERRPNYGIWVTGAERKIRQTLTALFWGDTPFEEPLWQMTHANGLEFSLANDLSGDPLFDDIHELEQQLSTKSLAQLVAKAEADLGGRLTDHGVLHLELAFAVQRYRMQAGHFLDPVAVVGLEHHPVRLVAQQLVQEWAVDADPASLSYEVNMGIMLLLACPKIDRWPGDLETNSIFPHLMASLMEAIGNAYEIPELASDATLRDGLIANVLPACFRQLFQVWIPKLREVSPLSTTKYPFENQLARYLGEEINSALDIKLPQSDVDSLAFLIRAAYIRKRPNKHRKVIVVCPSGMATAQLLIARLKARFPRLGEFVVVSVRELDLGQVSDADLIITTVSLQSSTASIPVIQVHPHLLPEDIASITEWLA